MQQHSVPPRSNACPATNSNQLPTVSLVVQGSTSDPKKPQEFPLKWFHFIFGIVQMIIGELIFVIDVAALCAHVGLPASLGLGIFCGVFVFVSGLLSLLAAKLKQHRLIVACMVINTIATAACVIVVFFESWAVDVYRELFKYRPGENRKLSFGYGKSVFLLVVCLFEFFATIVHAFLACRSFYACCKPLKTQPS